MSEWTSANEDTFEDLIKGDKVFVEFMAPWSGACTQIGPIMEDLSKENLDVKFVKVDVDEMPITTHDLDVSAVPTVYFYKDGELVSKAMGGRPKSLWQELINEYLGD